MKIMPKIILSLALNLFSISLYSQHNAENCFESSETLHVQGENMILDAKKQAHECLKNLEICHSHLSSLMPKISDLQTLCKYYYDNFTAKGEEYKELKDEIESATHDLPRARDSDKERFKINSLIITYNQYMKDIRITYDNRQREIKLFEKTFDQAKPSCEGGWLLLEKSTHLYLQGLNLMKESEQNLEREFTELEDQSNEFDEMQYFDPALHNFKQLMSYFNAFKHECYNSLKPNVEFKKILARHLRDINPFLSILLELEANKTDLASVFRLAMRKK